jgi:hypothetical protein
VSGLLAGDGAGECSYLPQHDCGEKSLLPSGIHRACRVVLLAKRGTLQISNWTATSSNGRCAFPSNRRIDCDPSGLRGEGSRSGAAGCDA